MTFNRIWKRKQRILASNVTLSQAEIHKVCIVKQKKIVGDVKLVVGYLSSFTQIR